MPQEVNMAGKEIERAEHTVSHSEFGRGLAIAGGKVVGSRPGIK
jgi:hypothetical protein